MATASAIKKLTVILHPSICLAYFLNWVLYMPEMETHVYLLMQTECNILWEILCQLTGYSKHWEIVRSKWSVFSTAILATATDDSESKLDHYYNLHVYPCLDEDALGWWKLHVVEIPIISCKSTNVLADPGVILLVEQHFSSSWQTLTNMHYHMIADITWWQTKHPWQSAQRNGWKQALGTAWVSYR